MPAGGEMYRQEDLPQLLLKCSDSGSFMNEISISIKSPIWGGDARVSIGLTMDDWGKWGLRAKASISWSSTGRSVASAVHTIALYQQAIEFAAFCEALING